jgi:hypothetical protein
MFCLLVGMAMALPNCVAQAEDTGRVMSVPYAVSKENIYKVTIVEIDGVAPEAAMNYHLPSGEHVIKVSLMLKVEWTPKLAEPSKSVYEKEIVLNIDSGTGYQIGARLDVDAPVESQLDGSFWEPIVYRKFSD